MKPGDLVECNGGYRGIVISITKLYPGHPHSPVDTLQIAWQGEEAPYTYKPARADFKSSVTVWAVKKVLSRADR